MGYGLWVMGYGFRAMGYYAGQGVPLTYMSFYSVTSVIRDAPFK
jgi:hypothetical protein